MSHGLVNNVGRSHSTPDTNVCNQFIPQVVSHPIIRKKCVLHIMDGIKGVYQGGPGGLEARVDLGEQRPPVRDRPGGDGPRRVAASSTPSGRRRACPPVGASGKLGLDPLGTEGFDIRQPQHIPLAANLGLGLFDFNSPRGRRFSIDHRRISLA